MERVEKVEKVERVERVVKVDRPVFMERLGQGFGLVSYERELGPEEYGALSVDEIHDFGYVFLDDVRLGAFDRRHRGVKVSIPKGQGPARRRLRILVEAMGRINSSSGMEDRKGLNGRVLLAGRELRGWTARLTPIDPDDQDNPPGNYRGTLRVDQPADTFLDMSGWTKGVVWVNGHNLGRFWCIGPQQTLYVPGCWLKTGTNEVVVLDFFGPRGDVSVNFSDQPKLDELHPELDFNRRERAAVKLDGCVSVAKGSFPRTGDTQKVMFETPVRGRTFVLQTLSSHDKRNLASISEFAFLDAEGNPLTALDLTIAGVDSEEEVREDGTAENAIDGQVETCWLTSSRTLPHTIAFDVSQSIEIQGFRYTPRQNDSVGRIKDWEFLVR